MLSVSQLATIEFIRNSATPNQLKLLIEHLVAYANGQLSEVEFNTVIGEMQFEISHGEWLDRYRE